MRYCSVASGSNGNCHYIESGEYRVLVDLGLSARQIEDGLRSVGIDPASINGIFVTHEHSDHVRGIGVWARRYKVPILATAGTWKGMERGLGPGIRRAGCDHPGRQGIPAGRYAHRSVFHLP